MKAWTAPSIAVFLLAAPMAAAQAIIPPTQAERVELTRQMDEGRVGIMTGSPGGTYIRLGADLQRLVETERGNNLRVIVMIGRGSVGNLQDLALLRYTDLALVQADVLLSMQQTSPSDFGYLNGRIGYIASFHPELIHVIAQGGPFEGPQALAGKRIAIGGSGSGTAITAPIVLKELIGVDFEPVVMAEGAALNDLLSEAPTIDGFVFVAGRGSSIFADISVEAATRIRERRIEFVPFRNAPPADSPYLANSIDDDDYPNLIPLDETVPVWAVPAVLAAYDWSNHSGALGADRYRRIESFVTAFFDNRLKLNDGEGGYNENWCEIDISRAVPGWERIRAAENWLAVNPGVQTEICADAAPAAAPARCVLFEKDMRSVGIVLTDSELTGSLFESWQATHPGQC